MLRIIQQWELTGCHVSSATRRRGAIMFKRMCWHSRWPRLASRLDVPGVSLCRLRRMAQNPVLKSQRTTRMNATPSPSDKDASVAKTDAEWKKVLTPEQYRVTRKKGTEAPFSGEYWNCQEGRRVSLRVLRGRRCSIPATKFDSGCGWPSFSKPMARRTSKNRRTAATAWSAPR